MPSHWGDISVLVHKTNVTSKDALPIKIYGGQYKNSSNVCVAGFGQTDSSKTNSKATQLMAVDLHLDTTEFCQNAVSDLSSGTMVCTMAQGGKGACLEDHGGPLAIQNGNEWGLLGISSYSAGNGCGSKGSSEIYTCVYPYVEWISKMTGVDRRDISQTSTSDTSTLSGTSLAETTSTSNNSDQSGGGSLKKSTTIVGAVCGSVGGILLSVLVFYLVRWYKRRIYFAKNPVQDLTVQGIMASEIGCAEIPAHRRNPNNTVEPTMPPAYEERDARANYTTNLNVVEKK